MDMSLGLVTLPLKYTTLDRNFGERQRVLMSALGAHGDITRTHTNTLLVSWS